MPHVRASAEAWAWGSLEHVLAARVRSLPGWDRVSYVGGPPGQGFSGQSGEAGALVPLCRRCPVVPAFSRAYHSTPPSGARVAHSTPPSGAEIGECPVAGEFRTTRRHRVARASRTRRHRVARWGCIQLRLRPAEVASSPLSYRAGSPDYCVSSGLVHGTVAVAPTVRRDDRVHLVAEAAPGVATSR